MIVLFNNPQLYVIEYPGMMPWKSSTSVMAGSDWCAAPRQNVSVRNSKVS